MDVYDYIFISLAFYAYGLALLFLGSFSNDSVIKTRLYAVAALHPMFAILIWVFVLIWAVLTVMKVAIIDIPFWVADKIYTWGGKK